ncbi:hypothetical protein EDB19DRAFT_1763049 [Suillus lakei]|nr:hypothetical protein EDB19DRAFT_1763049 [Suillus lakei]
MSRNHISTGTWYLGLSLLPPAPLFNTPGWAVHRSLVEGNITYLLNSIHSGGSPWPCLRPTFIRGRMSTFIDINGGAPCIRRHE